MAQVTQTLERNIQIVTTGPGVFPSRLGGAAFRFSTTYPKFSANQATISTSSTYTHNFQGITKGRFVFIATDTKLNVRMNGLGATPLGITSNLTTARVMVWEGSTTSLVLSNLSSAYVGNVEVMVAGS